MVILGDGRFLMSEVPLYTVCTNRDSLEGGAIAAVMALQGYYRAMPNPWPYRGTSLIKKRPSPSSQTFRNLFSGVNPPPRGSKEKKLLSGRDR